MPTNLTGLDLRRKVLEALGWKIDESFREGWRYWLVRPNGGDVLSSNLTIETVIERMPAIELDPAVSEPLFLEFCEKHEWIWRMWWSKNGDRSAMIQMYRNTEEAREDIECGDDTPDFEVTGSTPSEARAKAILAAVVQEAE